jgi:LPS sulfotransferase NodH/glycosyltransferase involved in cell wall biosynthesis
MDDSSTLQGADAVADVTILPRRRKVCLVTVEFHGLFKNGGIGTANTALALALAETGFDVTVAIANPDDSGPRLKAGQFAELQASWAKRGITLDYVRPHPHIAGSFEDPRTVSYCVFLYVRSGGFDIVLFNDNCGQGFYSLLAKHTGVFRNPPLMYVVAHGPVDWVHELNALEFFSRTPVATVFLERRSAALADVLVSPSRYLLDWMTTRGWIAPGQGLVVQNLLGIDELDVPVPDPGAARPVREIVFFGRQETRKGITLFCDALDLLDQGTDLSSVTVTFLGKFSRVGSLHSGIYIAERARRWRCQLRILAVYDQREGLAHLKRPGVLAVIPSRAENSPCVVAECLQLGLLFLATDTGGTPELVDAADRESCLFRPDPEVLARRLSEVLRAGHRVARLAVPPSQTRAQWMRLLSEQSEPVERALPPPSEVLVSACLVWSSSPHFQTCLDSLRRQTYDRLEIILVAKEGDPVQEAGAKVHWGAYESVGAARNAAARAASGEYLLFVDEALATLLPSCVETLMAAAQRTSADILTCFRELSTGAGMPKPEAREWELPIGGCAELGAVENCFGEGAVLIKASKFAEIRGFPADCEGRILEWAFLADAVLAGAALEVVPAPLIQLRPDSRRIDDGERTVEDHRRILRLYQDAPARMLSRLTESTLRIGRQNIQKMHQALQGVGPAARELAVRLASLDPNSVEALRALVSYCLERRMVELAVDFALHNDVQFLSEAVLAATRANEAAALDLIRMRRLRLRHTVDLTAELQRHAQAYYGLHPDELKRPSDGSLQHAVPPGGDAVVKIAGACPPGATAIHVVAIPDAGGPVQVCGVLCRFSARPTLSRSDFVSDGSAWWSGWVQAGKPGSRSPISIRLPEPVTEPLDLYLIARRESAPRLTPISVSWAEFKADLCLVGNVTPSALEMAMEVGPLPFECLERGELLTDTTNLTFKVYVPGNRTLLHPVGDRLALVRLPDALPPGSVGLRCVVSVEHEKAHPIEFGVWARPASAPLSETTALRSTEDFSGWLRVDKPLAKSTFSLLLTEPAAGPMDIYLATRVVGANDAYFCHAYWHEFMIIEDPRRQSSPGPTSESVSQSGRTQRLKASSGETVRASYLICGAARTGTNLLATAMRDSGLAGWPLEYFNVQSMNDPYMLRRLGLPAGTTDGPDFSTRLDNIMRSGTLRGVFASTVHWWDLQNLVAAVSSRRGRTICLAEAPGELRAFLPELRFVWLRRENKVAQAISHYLAIKTGVWSKSSQDAATASPEAVEVPYDFAAIHELVRSAELEEQGWREFLAGAADVTLSLTYEELASDFAAAVTRTLAFLGVSLPKAAVPPPAFRRQAGARSMEWERRYRSEMRATTLPAQAGIALA